MGLPQKPAKNGVGTLDLLTLSRLAKGSIQGYGIAELINQVSGALHVEEGSLYLALHRLESQLIGGASENNRRTRFYKLTQRRRRQITMEISNRRRIVAAINRAIEPVKP